MENNVVKPNLEVINYKTELEKTIKNNLENTIKTSLANQLKPNLDNNNTAIPAASLDNGISIKTNNIELTNGSSNYFDHYESNSKLTKKPSLYDKVILK